MQMRECAQSCSRTFLELGRRALKRCGALDPPLLISVLASPLALSCVCCVSASRGGVGLRNSAALSAVLPLQSHPVPSCSLSVFGTQQRLNSLEPWLLQSHRLGDRLCPLKNEMGTWGDPENRGKVIPYLLQHPLNLLDLWGWSGKWLMKNDPV